MYFAHWIGLGFPKDVNNYIILITIVFYILEVADLTYIMT